MRSASPLGIPARATHGPSRATRDLAVTTPCFAPLIHALEGASWRLAHAIGTLGLPIRRSAPTTIRLRAGSHALPLAIGSAASGLATFEGATLALPSATRRSPRGLTTSTRVARRSAFATVSFAREGYARPHLLASFAHAATELETVAVGTPTRAATSPPLIATSISVIDTLRSARSTFAHACSALPSATVRARDAILTLARATHELLRVAHTLVRGVATLAHASTGATHVTHASRSVTVGPGSLRATLRPLSSGLPSAFHALASPTGGAPSATRSLAGVTIRLARDVHTLPNAIATLPNAIATLLNAIATLLNAIATREIAKLKAFSRLQACGARSVGWLSYFMV